MHIVINNKKYIKKVIPYSEAIKINIHLDFLLNVLKFCYSHEVLNPPGVVCVEAGEDLILIFPYGSPLVSISFRRTCLFPTGWGRVSVR